MAAPKTRAKPAAPKDEKSDKEKAEETATAENSEVSEESARDRAAREKKEAQEQARAAQIEAGNLLERDGYEFESQTKETKVSGQVQEIIEELKKSEDPLVFSEVCKKVGANYPEDILPAMLSLEHVGFVRRWTRRETSSESRRGQTAYQWVGEEE